jgi:protein arginine N-methyltransferase 3
VSVLDLDFLETVKLVNYIRSEVKKGNQTPDVSSKSVFEDGIYLKPVLDDDALLYNLEDLEDVEAVEGGEPSDKDAGGSTEKRIIELQEELERLQGQFTDYRLAVQKSLNEQLLGNEDSVASSGSVVKKGPSDRIEAADADYFTSYSYNSTFSKYSYVILSD